MPATWRLSLDCRVNAMNFVFRGVVGETNQAVCACNTKSQSRRSSFAKATDERRANAKATDERRL
jgi:hypothetical protein